MSIIAVLRAMDVVLAFIVVVGLVPAETKVSNLITVSFQNLANDKEYATGPAIFQKVFMKLRGAIIREISMRRAAYSLQSG